MTATRIRPGFDYSKTRPRLVSPGDLDGRQRESQQGHEQLDGSGTVTDQGVIPLICASVSAEAAGNLNVLQGVADAFVLTGTIDEWI